MRDTISEHDGKLGAINFVRFDSIRVSRIFHIYFIDNGHGKPLLRKDYEELLDKEYEAIAKNCFKAYIADRTLYGRFLMPAHEFSIKALNLKYLSRDELSEYLHDRPHLIDVTDAKIDKKYWQIILKCQSLEKVYEKCGGVIETKLHNFIHRYINKDDEDQGLQSIKGVYALTKERYLKFIIETELI